MSKSSAACVPGYPPTTNGQRVECARVGRRETYRQVFLPGNPRLFRIARAVPDNGFEAAYALQEACARAASRVTSFRDKAWAQIREIHIALGKIRSRKRRTDRPCSTLSTALNEAFPFLGLRHTRLTEAVL